MKASLMLALFQIAICSSPLSVSPNLSIDLSTNNSISIYETDVLRDLSSLDGFNVNNYKGKAFDLIYFAEYNYQATSNSSFDLILYYYSVSPFYPSTDETQVPYINFQANDSGYNNCQLQLINSNGRFYKAKIMNSRQFYTPFLDERKYDLAGISFFSHYENKSENWTDHEIGQSYKYSGFASDKTLSCTTSGLETISIKVKGGSWHTASDYGNRNTLFYVWFSLPKQLTDGWFLSAIHYEYTKIQLKTLIAGTVPEHVDLSSGSGFNFTAEDSWDFYETPDGEKFIDLYNSPARHFDLETPTDQVSREAIDEKMQLYEDEMTKQKTYMNVTAHNSDMTITVPSSSMNKWEKFWTAVLFNMGGSNETYSEFPAWEIITTSDSELSDKLFSEKFFVDETQATEIKTDVYINSVDKDTYLFRFEILPYYSRTLDLHIFAPGITIGYRYGYYFDTYYIKNFDIIDFTFQNADEEIKVIPVVADPINISDFGERPDTPDWWGWLKKLITTILTIILTIVIVIILIYLLSQVIKILINKAMIEGAVKKANKKQEKKKKKR